MLSVKIPGDRTTAIVKMDGGHSTRLKLVQEYNVPNFCRVFYRQQAQQNEPISIRDVIQWVIKNKLSQRTLDFLN